MEQSGAVQFFGRLTTEDPAVILDPMRLEDAPELYAVIERNRQRLQEWLPWATPDYGPAHARRFLEDQVVSHARGTSLACAIRCHGSLAGAIGLHTIDEVNRCSSIGYWNAEEFSGRGIVTVACRAILAFSFDTLGLHRIEIRCATGNRRSCAIPQRLGFSEEGTLREAGRLGDRWVDLRVFSILDHEWRNSGGRI